MPFLFYVCIPISIIMKFKLFIILLFISLNFSFSKEFDFAYYAGGRFGYCSLELKLYKDSTYSFHEWNHMRNISDKGKWYKDKDNYILNSNKKTRWRNRGGKNSKKEYLFKKQKFIFIADTLKFIHKEKDAETNFNEYYTMYKQHQ